MTSKNPTTAAERGGILRRPKVTRIPAEDPEQVRLRDRARDSDFPAYNGTDPLRFLGEPDE